MTIHNLGFNPKQLRKGAIMGTIAHAIWVADDPLVAALQAWDGPHYLLNDVSGTIATITFGESGVIGVFFDAKSARNPIASSGPYSTDRYLEGMPDDLMLLAKKHTLQFMLQEYQGKEVPVVTAALWSKEGELVAVEPWEDVLENGGHIIRLQLKDDETALGEWQDNYALSGEQVGLLRSLFQRKLDSGDARLRLADAEKRLLAGAGAEQSKDIFASIGIDV